MKHGMTDQEEAFVTVLMKLVPETEERRDEFEREALQLCRAGWTMGDAKAYFMCAEELNPSLDEETALRRMDAIRAKYEPITYESYGSNAAWEGRQQKGDGGKS